MTVIAFEDRRWPDGVPGQRFPGEPSRAYEAFQAYLSLGPRRSLRRLADSGATALKLRRLQTFSAMWSWPARAADHDCWVAREAHLDHLEVVARMNRMHAAVAATALAKASERIRNIDPARLSVREAVLLMTAATTMERQARGEAGLVTQETGDANERHVHGGDVLELLRRHPRIGQLADEITDALAADATLVSHDQPSDQ